MNLNIPHIGVRMWLPLLLLSLCIEVANAQVTDTIPPDEEDYSQYDNLSFADKKAKNYCTAKIPGLTPQKFISIGYDFQAPSDLTADTLGANAQESSRFTAHGLRLSANIPVISNNKFIWQMGATYWQTNYSRVGQDELNLPKHPFIRNLTDRGLRTLGLNTTIFKPFNERRFLLIQASADLNGDYGFSDFQELNTLRYSAAAIYGFKPHDRLMWGLGAARAYRVGEVNYLPVVLYNWTAENRKWGTEILFPARGHVRRNFNPRTILQGGWELEGNTYRLDGLAAVPGIMNPELRRGEARIRLILERQLTGFFWISAQVGLRHNWSFNLDQGEFFRGFTGNQAYLMENTLSNPVYFNISFNLVSP